MPSNHEHDTQAPCGWTTQPTWELDPDDEIRGADDMLDRLMRVERRG